MTRTLRNYFVITSIRHQMGTDIFGTARSLIKVVRTALIDTLRDSLNRRTLINFVHIFVILSRMCTNVRITTRRLIKIVNTMTRLSDAN